MKQLFAIVITIGLLVSSRQDFLDDDYIQVTKQPTTSGSLTALEKCGEGSSEGVLKCVPYHACKPKNLLPETTNNNHSCEKLLDVCCKVSTVDIVTKNPILPDIGKNRCGIRNLNGADGVTTENGNEANFGEFPWMVEVMNTDFDEATQKSPGICGGSLITLEVVLTAAHCVHTYVPEDIIIRAGEWDTQSQSEQIPHQEISVSNIVVHPQFKKQNLHNDVALLILSHPFNRDKNIGTICLPAEGQIFNSKNCITTGWGKNKFATQGEKRLVLKKMELPIVEPTTCQETLRQTRLGSFFTLDPSFVCAGGEEGQDMCLGDGGSPLVCPDPGNPQRYIQAGAVAWNIDCGKNKSPGVYADVSKFRNWIDEQLQRFNIDIKPYLV